MLTREVEHKVEEGWGAVGVEGAGQCQAIEVGWPQEAEEVAAAAAPEVAEEVVNPEVYGHTDLGEISEEVTVDGAGLSKGIITIKAPLETAKVEVEAADMMEAVLHHSMQKMAPSQALAMLVRKMRIGGHLRTLRSLGSRCLIYLGPGVSYHLLCQ